jgi:hypothetical protein
MDTWLLTQELDPAKERKLVRIFVGMIRRALEPKVASVSHVRSAFDIGLKEPTTACSQRATVIRRAAGRGTPRASMDGEDLCRSP